MRIYGKQTVKYVVAIVLVCQLFACGGNEIKHRSHYQLHTSELALPKKVVLLPVDLSVYALSTGGVVEEVKKWSDQANKNFKTALRNYLQASNIFKYVNYPKISKPHKKIVDEHLALYNYVGEAALNPLNQKSKTFDLGLGSGLRFLSAKTGADAAMIVIGVDYVASQGRKKAAVGLVLAGILSGYGTKSTFENAVLVIGLVDLKTGKLIWIKREKDKAETFNKRLQLTGLLNKVFADYPGSKK